MPETESTGTKKIANNRRAFHDYTVDEKIECGISLAGTEVKALREGRISFGDAYALIHDGELWLVALRISPYSRAGIFSHDPDRERKLLVHRQELRRLKRRVDEKGYTLIPLRLYFKRSIVKVEIGLCKGKRQYDKREDIKARDHKRDAEREAREQLR
ncbi:MAG: SsrA-binding protein SmpB [Spirochaetia bacterium]